MGNYTLIIKIPGPPAQAGQARNDNHIMTPEKQKTMINFKKAQSLLGKMGKMVEDGEYCIHIMQHNLAVIGLLKSAHQMLMESHLNTCFKSAMSSKNEVLKKKMTKEILALTKLYTK